MITFVSNILYCACNMVIRDHIHDLDLDTAIFSNISATVAAASGSYLESKRVLQIHVTYLTKTLLSKGYLWF